MHAQITLNACKSPKPPKSLGSHRRFRVRNLLCESRSPGPVYIGEIRRCRFDVSGPCAQLLSGSHRRFRVRNLLCDAPRFSETAAPLGSHRRLSGTSYVGPPDFRRPPCHSAHIGGSRAGIPYVGLPDFRPIKKVGPSPPHVFAG